MTGALLYFAEQSGHISGMLKAMVRKTYAEAITEETLFTWHKVLLKENKGIHIGMWRSHEEPMQVISWAIGREKVHFESPPSSRLPDEMNKFIHWFNNTAPGGINEIKKAPIRSAIAMYILKRFTPLKMVTAGLDVL
jgi:Fic family protein